MTQEELLESLPPGLLESLPPGRDVPLNPSINTVALNGAVGMIGVAESAMTSRTVQSSGQQLLHAEVKYSAMGFCLLGLG